MFETRVRRVCRGRVTRWRVDCSCGASTVVESRERAVLAQRLHLHRFHLGGAAGEPG